jgi:hypothetical protein
VGVPKRCETPALLMRKAETNFRQVPGDDAVTTPPFNAVSDVCDLGAEFHLGGISFSGPIGDRFNTQKPWSFSFPFTT